MSVELMNLETETVEILDVETIDTTTKKVKKEKVAKAPTVYPIFDNSNLINGLQRLNGLNGEMTVYRGEVRFKTNLNDVVKNDDRLFFDMENLGWTMNTEKNFFSIKLK